MQRLLCHNFYQRKVGSTLKLSKAQSGCHELCRKEKKGIEKKISQEKQRKES